MTHRPGTEGARSLPVLFLCDLHGTTSSVRGLCFISFVLKEILGFYLFIFLKCFWYFDHKSESALERQETEEGSEGRGPEIRNRDAAAGTFSFPCFIPTKELFQANTIPEMDSRTLLPCG